MKQISWPSSVVFGEQLHVPVPGSLNDTWMDANRGAYGDDATQADQHRRRKKEGGSGGLKGGRGRYERTDKRSKKWSVTKGLQYVVALPLSPHCRFSLSTSKKPSGAPKAVLKQLVRMTSAP